MSDDKETPDEKGKSGATFGETVKNVGTGLGASALLILGIVNAVMGVNQEEKTNNVAVKAETAKQSTIAVWDTLKNKVDEQATVINTQMKRISDLSDRLIVVTTKLEMLQASYQSRPRTPVRRRSPQVTSSSAQINTQQQQPSQFIPPMAPLPVPAPQRQQQQKVMPLPKHPFKGVKGF